MRAASGNHLLDTMKTLLPWLGSILSEAVSGFAHGAVVGGGTGTVVTGDIKAAVHSAIIGGCLAAAKDVALYINANPMPNFLAAPAPAPVAAAAAPVHPTT